MNNIKMFGDVEITNGDNVVTGRNHFLNNGFRSIYDIILLTYINAYNKNDACTYYYYLPANSWYMRLGTDTTTVTDPTMDELTSLIAIAPTSQQMFITDGTDDGHYIITFRSIWATGTISGTVGEMGLYMRCGENINQHMYSSKYYTAITPPVKLVARMTCIDNDFSPIVIDETKPFIVDWNMNFQI